MTKAANSTNGATNGADVFDIRDTISIDIGGTFTDCYVVYDGRTVTAKAPTTRHRLASGFGQAISQCAAELGISVEQLLGSTDIVRYATTLAMNALIERNGPPLGLITTQGFEDTIYIGRGAQWHDGLPMERKRMVARGQRPQPLIDRARVVGIRERVDDGGRVITPLDPDQVREKIRTLVDRGAMGFVVALMQSHRNPAHERTIKEIISEEYPQSYLGSQPILLSSEVLCKGGEYQRDMTTVLAAYLHRTMAEELTELGNSLHDQGYRRRLFIANSAGGANPLERTSAVETYNAGPVAGVIGSTHVARSQGISNVIVSDMGGTSFDLGTVVNLDLDGSADDSHHFYSHMPLIDRFRVGISMIETKSIGAGGGSIARYNELLDSVEVGPASAGSNPGPAAFDLGGDDSTVTDADVVLGYVDPDYFLGGSIPLNRDAAADAVRRGLAEPLGIELEEAAMLIKDVIDAKMGNEIFKEVNLKGYDPADFSLFAFGGAGGTHVAGYGGYVEPREMRTFPFASVFSAFGIANTDFVRSYERGDSLLLYHGATGQWLENYGEFNKVVEEMQFEALKDAKELDSEHVVWSLDLHMRYGMQPHVTRIRSPRLFVESPEDVEEVYQAFEREYARVYSESAIFLPGGVEILGFVLWSQIRTQKVELARHRLGTADPSAAHKSDRPAFWGTQHGWLQTPVYDLASLRPGNEIAGPAIVEATDTTIVVDPRRRFQLDELANGVMTGKE